MKKILACTAVFVLGLGTSALADTIGPNESTSCKDANAIEVQTAQVAPEYNDKFGYTTNNRGTASLVVWKSSNFTTVPLTLGPNDSNKTIVATDKGRTGIGVRGEMGRQKVKLTHQPAFSRGDSIGDISGLVKFTNVGPVPVTIKCK